MNKITRNKVYNKYNGHCAYCGCEIKENAFEVDHFSPKLRWDEDKGGSDTLENYMPAWRKCNRQKSSMSIEAFRNTLKNKINVLNRDITAYETAKRYGLVEETNEEVIF